MTEDELGRVLRRMYDEAPDGQQVTSIHLFGIEHAAEIEEAGLTAAGLVRASGINRSYATEVAKGIRLAKFVMLKPRS